MKYMLDTNICIYIIRKKPPSVIRRMLRIDPGNVCISAITLSELEYGASKSAFPNQNKLALAEFLAPIAIAAYDDQASAEYGELRAKLEKAGTPIGSLDVLIAAHALSLQVSLVTNNEREFKRVPGLRVVNWAK